METRRYRRAVVWLMSLAVGCLVLLVAADVYVIAEGWSVEIVESE